MTTFIYLFLDVSKSPEMSAKSLQPSIHKDVMLLAGKFFTQVIKLKRAH